MHKRLFFICLFTLIAFVTRAQLADTVKMHARHDSVGPTQAHPTLKPFKPQVSKAKVYHPDSTHSPRKAVMRSLMVPGWGQVYNHQWWKVPIIYGGFSLLGAAIIYNQHYFNEYVTEAKFLRDNVNSGATNPYPQYASYNLGYQAFFDAAESNRRNRDLSILGVLGAWGINIIDAYIDAKFKHSYTMDNNLSFKLEPALINQSQGLAFSNASYTPALKLTLAF